MYVLRVTGTYYKPDGSPEKAMSSMLNYDQGELQEWKPIVIMGLGNYEGFVAEVRTNHYTPARWATFGMKAEIRQKMPGRAFPDYPDIGMIEERQRNGKQNGKS